ncbi:hypothetical protein J8F10_06375 [Gemmata sp. G18]|uniref:Uncharacterized protein n=1 Tax=Gemmata palustris TaxID=2822762 RepID=A0ABS5BNK9_9BACT|nr:hypothetical protein [Gemmata palustris]MBP3954905.1 hypothetical protein [Gemmata palustris]
MFTTLYGLLSLVVLAIAAIWLVKIVLPKPFVMVKWFGLQITFRDTPPPEDPKKAAKRKPKRR